MSIDAMKLDEGCRTLSLGFLYDASQMIELLQHTPQWRPTYLSAFFRWQVYSNLTIACLPRGYLQTALGDVAAVHEDQMENDSVY